MRKSVFILFGILITLTSCRKDFDAQPSSGALQFSEQTVYLDTVFSEIGSSTYMLKVYNRSNKDISIPSIRLAKADSRYRLMIDGLTGNDADNSGYGDGRFFSNVEILAKDSLFIFIETTAHISDTEPDLTYNDQILFDSGSNQQAVNLVTLIQDARFIFPNRQLVTNVLETFELNAGSGAIQGHTLLTDAELHWTNEKPYVVYGYAYVPPGKILVIDAGTRVHFHADSGIMVGNGARIEINGALSTYDIDGNILVNNEVTFEGDRLEPSFEDTPGQWGTILISSSGLANEGNTINHLTLKNAAVGLFIQRSEELTMPKVKITNSQVYNSSISGILARTADVTGENLVINLAGQASLACSMGGSYSFTHCTFNNNWASSKQVAVSIDNFIETQTGNVAFPLTKADFFNCIIYGSNQVELLLSQDTSETFAFNFDSCLVKFFDANTTIAGDPNYNIIRDPAINANIINSDPMFQNANRNKLNIDGGSPAVEKGRPIYADAVPFDIRNNPRPTILGGNPDIGAYQSRPFPE